MCSMTPSENSCYYMSNFQCWLGMEGMYKAVKYFQHWRSNERHGDTKDHISLIETVRTSC